MTCLLVPPNISTAVVGCQNHVLPAAPRPVNQHINLSRRSICCSAGFLDRLQKSIMGSREQSTVSTQPSSSTNQSQNPAQSSQQSSLFGSQPPEFPPYTVLQRTPQYDLRLYDIYPVVEMDYARREEGYALLGSYIDGENSEGVKFNYTQPVVMRYEPGGMKTMQMFIGTRRGSAPSDAANSSSSLADLPKPISPAVRVSVAGGELVAVLKFDGFITPQTAEAARKQLIAALQKDGLQLAPEEEAGFFRAGQYGAVYQVGGRLNEMMLRVKT